jgi:hypothetical protein
MAPKEAKDESKQNNENRGQKQRSVFENIKHVYYMRVNMKITNISQRNVSRFRCISEIA